MRNTVVANCDEGKVNITLLTQFVVAAVSIFRAVFELYFAPRVFSSLPLPLLVVS